MYPNFFRVVATHLDRRSKIQKRQTVPHHPKNFSDDRRSKTTEQRRKREQSPTFYKPFLSKFATFGHNKNAPPRRRKEEGTEGRKTLPQMSQNPINMTSEVEMQEARPAEKKYVLSPKFLKQIENEATAIILESRSKLPDFTRFFSNLRVKISKR